MSDFLKYWDTRIDANERFFNNYQHIANFAFSECQALWEHMEEERKAILTRHNALVDAVVKYLAAADEADMAVIGNRLTSEMLTSLLAARDEVDRLIDDCKGEG